MSNSNLIKKMNKLLNMPEVDIKHYCNYTKIYYQSFILRRKNDEG